MNNWFQDVLVPSSHPATHGSIAANQPYPMIPIPSHSGRSTSASVKPTNTSPNRYLTIFIFLIPFTFLIIYVLSHAHNIFLCWFNFLLAFNLRSAYSKIEKFLTQRLIFWIIKVWIYVMTFSTLYQQHSLHSGT